jgi:hypothetical protein
MSDFIRVTISGQEALFVALSSLDARISDLRPSWPKVYARRAGHIREQFDSEGGRTGQHWELSAAYAAQKAKAHPGKPVMQGEGLLLASLTNKDAEGAIYEEHPDRLISGSSLPYALAQVNAGHDLFGEREEDAEEDLNIIADDLTAYAKELGLRP